MTTQDAGAPELGCGADYDELVAQVAGRRIPDAERASHQQACPHCRAVLAELEELWAPVLTLAAENVRAPGGLVEEVMARVRELPRNTSYASLEEGPLGRTRVAARVIGAIARRAAVQVPGISAAVGGSRGGPRPGGTSSRGTSVELSGRHVVVEIALVVAQGAAIPRAAAQVRRQVRHDVARLAGVTVAAVDIAVVDVAE